MTCYKFECSHWWKIYLKKNPLQDLLSGLNAAISTKESTRIITGHVIYNPAYTYNFQLKTTQVMYAANDVFAIMAICLKITFHECQPRSDFDRLVSLARNEGMQS